MTTLAASRPALRWWPCFLGGLLWPPVTLGLRSWLPPYVAGTLAFALLWAAVGLLFLRVPPSASWRLRRWLLGGVAAALVFGSLAYWLRWP